MTEDEKTAIALEAARLEARRISRRVLSVRRDDIEQEAYRWALYAKRDFGDRSDDPKHLLHYCRFAVRAHVGKMCWRTSAPVSVPHNRNKERHDKEPISAAAPLDTAESDSATAMPVVEGPYRPDALVRDTGALVEGHLIEQRVFAEINRVLTRAMPETAEIAIALLLENTTPAEVAEQLGLQKIDVNRIVARARRTLQTPRLWRLLREIAV